MFGRWSYTSGKRWGGGTNKTDQVTKLVHKYSQTTSIFCAFRLLCTLAVCAWYDDEVIGSFLLHSWHGLNMYLVDTYNIYYVVHSSCSTMLKSLGIIFHPSESVFFMQLTAQDQEQIKICQPWAWGFSSLFWFHLNSTAEAAVYSMKPRQWERGIIYERLQWTMNLPLNATSFSVHYFTYNNWLRSLWIRIDFFCFFCKYNLSREV